MTSSEKWHRRRQAFGSGEERTTDLEGDLDPEEAAEDWVYTEKFIYMPHCEPTSERAWHDADGRAAYFVCDHKQGFRDETAEPDLHGVPAPIPRVQPAPELLWPEEEARRWGMRKQLFPALPDNFVVFANFNQLYKVRLLPPSGMQGKAHAKHRSTRSSSRSGSTCSRPCPTRSFGSCGSLNPASRI